MITKVSLIVPVYNNEKYIGKCIGSILNQTYKNIELIIINDGSKDNSDNIITNFQKTDERIKYIKQENSGPSQARNIGINIATGKYLMFIDSDDTVDKYYVEYMLKEIESNDYDIVCCGYKDISRFGVVKCNDFSFDLQEKMNKFTFFEHVCNGTGGVLWSKIIKKQIVDKNQLNLDKDIFMCEDLIFILEYISKCKSFSVLNKYLYNYNRLNDLSISSNISMNYVENHINVCKKINDILKYENYKKENIEMIILMKIQSIVISILEKQGNNLYKIGLKKCTKNITDILEIEYISLYIDKFNTDNKLHKPYITFIKNKNITLALIYSYLINKINSKRRGLKYRNIKEAGEL